MKIQNSIKSLIREVENTPLPGCISYSIRTFNDLSRKSNEASLEIRKNYLDIWKEYINRPRIGKTEKLKFSNYLMERFGRQRVCKFHELCQVRRDRRDWMTIQSHVLRAELKLMTCSKGEIGSILEWVSNWNLGVALRVPNDWINWISPKHVSEISIWRLLNLLKE